MFRACFSISLSLLRQQNKLIEFSMTRRIQNIYLIERALYIHTLLFRVYTRTGFRTISSGIIVNIYLSCDSRVYIHLSKKSYLHDSAFTANRSRVCETSLFNEFLQAIDEIISLYGYTNGKLKKKKIKI